jgi:hypothetical protein
MSVLIHYFYVLSKSFHDHGQVFVPDAMPPRLERFFVLGLRHLKKLGS